VNRGYTTEDIVKANIDCFEKASNPSDKHVEFITVTRNGKTFTQRYRKNTPVVQEPKTVMDTKSKAAAYDKIFHSNYYNGEFYDNNGKKLHLPDDWKDYAKKLKNRNLSDVITDAHIESIHLMDSEGLSDEEKLTLKKQIYKNERQRFVEDILPKIKEREEKQEAWGKKNETRLKNIHKESFSKEGVISSEKRSLAKLDNKSTFSDVAQALSISKVRLGSEIGDKKITYKFNDTEYEDKFDNFLTKLNSKISAGTFKKNTPIGLSDFKVEDLEAIPEDKIPAVKSWEEFFQSQKDQANI